MLANLFENIVVTLATGAIICILKAVYNYMKESDTSAEKPSEITPIKILKQQFFISLFTFACAISIAWTTTILGVKIILTLVSCLTFLTIWGAFEAAVAFYPCQDVRENEPSKNTAKEHRDN